MIQYVRGDATKPQGIGNKLIVHVVNNANGWGAGFVLALSRRWKGPELQYRQTAKVSLELGTVQFIQVESDIMIANMVAQSGYGSTKIRSNSDGKESTIPSIRYWALEKCLGKVADFCIEKDFSIHGPRFGCGLAGGTWEEVERIIDKTLVFRQIPVTIYDL